LRKRDAIVAHEQVVILNGNGPVRRKAKFKACPHGTAPAGFGGLIPYNTRRGEEGAVFVVGDRSAAFHVPEDVVPGIADLAGEQADGGSSSRTAARRAVPIRNPTSSLPQQRFITV
jgi:hypothetical protein